MADSVRDPGRAPVLTIALIVSNVLVFLYEVSLPDAWLNELVFRWGVVPLRQTMALDVAPWAIGHWLVPLFTSMFLHGGWLHIIGNMLFLWTFGPAIEQHLGKGMFLLLYLVGGVIAAQAQVFTDPLSRVPMVGASGAIASVLGAYLLLFPLARIVVLLPILFIPLFFELPALVFLGLWFVEQFLIGTATALTPAAGEAAVAWWAHIGGFVAGLVLGGVLCRKRGCRRPQRRQLGRPLQPGQRYLSASRSPPPPNRPWW